MNHSVYLSSHVTCAHCGHQGAVVRLEPAYQGWEYWCVNCQHLTQPFEQAEAALQNAQANGAIGIVSAVSCPWPDLKALVDQHVNYPLPKPRPRPIPKITFIRKG